MNAFHKKSLSERDICTKFITPALVQAGWDLQTQIREEVSFTKGRVIVRGKLVSRGKEKRADYILYYKNNIPLAIVEAKDNQHSVGDGMQQALEYGEMLQVPFILSSNGDGFLFRNNTLTAGDIECELPLDAFPSPDELWRQYCAWKGIADPALSIITQDYYSDGSGKAPRYYQVNAINRTLEAIARGDNRLLLVMATGTGKTLTAFQIVWRLWKSKAKRRILFLADRNILVDQTKTNDFKPFGTAMTKIQKRQIDKSYEIYLALYQAVSGTEEAKNIYKQFTPDFFDLVIVDECHRGSAADDSAWREILEYFSAATHIGLTATPKETKDVSNIDYFGKPVYSYSLKDGIDDGFLAPYKVVRVDLDRDLAGWRPERGKRDKHGQAIEDRIYNQRDFDRNLVMEQRTRLIAKRVSEFLKGTNRYDKTIVFCEDIDHAERMRQALVNENSDIAAYQPKYVMRITGDNPEGKAELENFIMPESKYPVIVTTSELMTTGVDAQTCKLIVLDKRIESITKFKQIVGRGTRNAEDFGKLYFTIIDFKNATELFADPDFDGDPVQIYEPKGDDPIVPPDDGDDLPTSPTDGQGGTTDAQDREGNDNAEIDDSPATILTRNPRGQGRIKYVVNDVSFTVIGERVQYYDREGKLITESLKDYTRKTVQKEFGTLDEFLRKWSKADKKQAVLDELQEQGVLLEAIADEIGKELDPFDMVCHVAFGQPPLTRRERAANVRKRDYFTKYGEQARAVLEALLEKYADAGIHHIEDINVLKVQPIDRFGTPVEIINGIFGSKAKYTAAIRELEEELYRVA